MSPRYSIAPAAAMKDARLPLSGKALLALLGTYSDKNGWCHPKQSELAAALGVRRDYVCRILRVLVQLGYVETRSFSASRRGRVSLEYRVKTDLADEVVQAAENSRCVADVDDSPTRLCKPLKTADVHYSPHRGRVGRESTSVEETSLRSVSKLKNDPKHFPENFVEAWERWPQRGRSNKAKSAQAWAVANRSHTAASVLSAFDAYLAGPDARKDAGAYVPALERWLRDKLEAWIELSAGRPSAIDQTAERLRVLAETGFWNPKWGPQPAKGASA